MGFGGAAGRLIELGQRQRRAQFEAARALLLRDGDGGQERFFRRRGVGGVALAAGYRRAPDAVRLRMRDSPCDRTSPALRRGSRERGRDRPLQLRPRPAQSSTTHRTTEYFVRAASRPRGACPRALRRAHRSQRSSTPGETRQMRHHIASSCSRARLASSNVFGVARAWSPRIRSNRAAMHFSKREHADMGQARKPSLHAFDKRNRAIDLAERP